MNDIDFLVESGKEQACFETMLSLGYEPMDQANGPVDREKLIRDANSHHHWPELVNPVQMQVDTKGRLWVAAWPTYPKWDEGMGKLMLLLVCFTGVMQRQVGSLKSLLAGIAVAP